MIPPAFAVVPLAPEQIDDELLRVWRETNAALPDCHYRHTADYYLANKLGRPAGRRLTPFGVREGDRWRGFFVVAEAEEKLAFTAAEKSYFGFRVRVGRINYPGLPGVENEEQLAEVLRRLAEAAPQLDGWVVDAMDLDSPLASLWKTGRRLPGLFPFYSARRLQVHRVVDKRIADGARHALSSKARQHHRREIRAMAEKRGATEIREFRTPAEAVEFVRDAAIVTARGWKAAAVGDEMTDADRPYYEALARQGLFLGYLMYVAGEPVAMLDARTSGPVIALYRTSYYARFAEFSPGLLLINEAFDRAGGNEQCRVIDFGFGDAEFKRRLANRSYPEAQVWYFRNRLRLRAATALLAAYHAVYDGLKRAAAAVGLQKKLKSLARGEELAPTKPAGSLDGLAESQAGDNEENRAEHKQHAELRREHVPAVALQDDRPHDEQEIP